MNLVLQELQENYFESVMISFPNYGSNISLKEVLPLWNIVEEFIDQKKILSAGVCDFMLPLLADLNDAAKVFNPNFSILFLKSLFSINHTRIKLI